METVLDHAFEAGVARVTLTTFRGVPLNEPFYQRLRFTLVPPGERDARLSETLAVEAAGGMPAERRCAMQRLTQGGARDPSSPARRTCAPPSDGG